MTEATTESGGGHHLLSVVALLHDLPEDGLVRGQGGTIVEELGDATALLEFTDDQGRVLRDRRLARATRCCALRTAPMAT